jgi:plastocyanin
MRATSKKSALTALLLCALLICGAQTAAQDVDVTVLVELRDAGTNARVSNASEAVVWLSHVPGNHATATRNFVHPTDRLRLAQHNKSFEPRLLVLPVGSEVEFPNRDPFFHNVFSLFEGKRFDLGLYEAGTTRNVVFDRPGISYIFCNIHSEMSAVVIALETPYYGVSNPQGEILIPSVPSGRYVMHVWHQSSLPEVLDGLTREITVSRTESSLGVIRLTQTTLASTHKNKYGHDYEPPAPTSPAYKRP